jgi:hypothetical protein
MFSADGYGPRLVALGPREVQVQDAVAIFRLDAVGLQIHRQRDRAVEFACNAFSTMHADAVGVGYRFLTGDAYRVFLRFDLQTVLVNAWQLDNRQKLAAVLEDVDGWERPLACGLILQPIAGQTGLERALQMTACGDRQRV